MSESTRRILIVDDEAEDGELTRRRLASVEASIDFHEGPAGAVDAMHSGNYDLVLLDVNMPGFSGLQILGALDKDKARGRVILYSSIEEKGLAEMSASAGVEYLSKSIPKDDLVARVRAWLDGE
jgi:CheY-like chemotaxis protein